MAHQHSPISVPRSCYLSSLLPFTSSAFCLACCLGGDAHSQRGKIIDVAFMDTFFLPIKGQGAHVPSLHICSNSRKRSDQKKINFKLSTTICRPKLISHINSLWKVKVLRCVRTYKVLQQALPAFQTVIHINTDAFT